MINTWLQALSEVLSKNLWIGLFEKTSKVIRIIMETLLLAFNERNKQRK